jgi:hypothetical protein
MISQCVNDRRSCSKLPGSFEDYGGPLSHPGKPGIENQTRSKRSRFITLVHAAAKSFTNFSFESEAA